MATFQAAPATSAITPQTTAQLIPRPVVPAPAFAGQGQSGGTTGYAIG